MFLLFLLGSLFAADPTSATVTMPWRDFQDLYKRGQAPADVPQVAPRDYTLDHAVYTAKVQGEGDDAWAAFHLSVRGDIHKAKGWSLVPLLSTTAALKSAKIDGKDAPIFIQDGFYTLITDKSGPFSIELDFGVALASADGETGLSLPLAATGATEVSLSAQAAEKLEFEIANARGMVVTRNGNEQRVEAAIPAQGSLAISWRRELPEEKAQAARVYAQADLLVGVAEGVMSCNATVNYTVLHQGVDNLRIQLPKDVTVLDVKGAGIRDWTVGADGIVSVVLNYAALGAYRLSIDYERALTGEVPVPRVLDVAREKTYVGVDARTAVELVSGNAAGATPIDVRELPASILGLTDFPVLLAYKARGGEVKIPLEVKTHADVDMLVTLVDAAMADVLITPDGRRMVHMQYAVRNNRNQFLKLQMPADAEVWSASVAGRPVKIAKAEEGMLVPLVRSDASSGALSGFVVDVVYVQKGGALTVGNGNLRIELPKVNAPTSQVQLSVYVPYALGFKKHSDDGSLHHVDYFSASPQLPQLAPDVARQAQMEMNATGNAQAASLAQGVDPVQVNLPLSGNVRYYEKTLALDESLWVSFDYSYKPKK